MFTPVYNLEKFISEIGQFETIITANQRLFFWLYSKNKGLDVITYSDWQKKILQRLGSSKKLINDSQSFFLWEAIVENTLPKSLLANTSQLTKQMMSSWSVLKQYDIRLTEAHFSDTEEARYFYQCAKRYEAKLDAQGLIDNASVTIFLTQELKKQSITLPRKIYWLGFDDFSPSQKALQGCLQELQVASLPIKRSVKPNYSVKKGFSDTLTEIKTMAKWAYAAIKKDPQQQIVCVVPELTKWRNTIIAIFQQTFHPDALLQQALHPEKQAFNISQGEPLAKQPLIFTALTLLKCTEKNVKFDDINYLLRSFYLVGYDGEYNERALFADWLKKKQIETAPLNTWQVLAKQYEKCPVWENVLDNIAQLEKPKSATPEEWLDCLQVFIACHSRESGNPGTLCVPHAEGVLEYFAYTEDSYQTKLIHQQIESWKTVLATFTDLGEVVGKINWQKAIKHLLYIANTTVFQPKNTHAKVHIMGVLEVSSLPFDKVWVMGCDANAWPQRFEPDPFIPIHIQRQFDLPNSSAKHEYVYYQRLTERLKISAPEVIFSYAQTKDSVQLEASPLLNDVPDETETVESGVSVDYPATLKENYAPAVGANDPETGHVQLLKTQAACPFKAFACYRLKAGSSFEKSFGIEPYQRGNLVHYALEYCWKELKNSEKLISYTQNALEILIMQSIVHAFEKASIFSLSFEMKAIESDRLRRLLLSWFGLEKQRMPFKISGLEHSLTYQLKGLKLKLSVDRIDQLASGDYCIIDYKTTQSALSVKQWESERPDEPQLPLYAIVLRQKLVGLAFAQLETQRMKFIGIGTQKFAEKIQTITDTAWEEQLNTWQENLEQLAQQFLQGYAAVDPKYGETTCRHCDYPLLCRVGTK